LLLLASDTAPKVAVLMKELRRHLNELLKAKVRSDMSIRAAIGGACGACPSTFACLAARSRIRR
jgi:hypothetical protein